MRQSAEPAIEPSLAELTALRRRRASRYQPTARRHPDALGRRATQLPEVLRFLKQRGRRSPIAMLYDLTAIDERVRTHRDGQPASDFTVVYHLLSFERNEDVRIKVALRGDDLHAADASTGLWPSANWYEREVWDMFGIGFERPPAPAPHPDAAAPGQGHPLRKDHPARATEMDPFALPDEQAGRSSRRRCASCPRTGA